MDSDVHIGRDPRASVADSLNRNVPLTVGVPAITPEVGLSARPGGSVPEAIDHSNAPTPSALTCTAYADPTVAG